MTATTPLQRPPWQAGAERRWEERVLRAAHPVAYPLLSRVSRPAYRVPGVGVVVGGTELVREVLSDSARFSKTGPGTSSDFWNPVLGPTVLLNMHGAEHAALRRRLAPIFTPAAVSGLVRTLLEREVGAVRDRLLAGHEVDLVPVAQRCAGEAIAQLVGIPGEALGAELFARVSGITNLVRLRRNSFGPREVRLAREAMAGLMGHAATAYQQGDEGTVPGRMRRLGLTEQEAVGAVGAFVVTGTETVVAHLPRAAAILTDTQWWPRVTAGSLDAVVGETLRVTTPSLATLRRAVTDTRIGPVRVAAGERVVVATFQATRGVGGFAPDSYQQGELRQLWFGAGPHFCIGAPLATAQVRLLLGVLAQVAQQSVAAGGGGLRIVHRRAQRKVLIPAYATMRVSVA